MTTYKEIKGTQIEVVSSDPSNPVEGQVWYNSTDQAVKGSITTSAGSWASGGNMNKGTYYGASSGESSSSALYTGGKASPVTGATELYDGTSWTEVNDLNTARELFSATGTQTSTVAFGGGPSNTGVTESWNGTNWTEVADLNQPRQQCGSAGASNTSALAFGGSLPPGTSYAQTESWNGSSWTETADLNTGRGFVFGGPIGVQTDALCGSGYIYGPGSSSQNTEIWNGSSWTEVNDSPPAAGGGARFGTTSSALHQNGTTVITWNGTSWSTDTSNSNNLTSRQGAGTTSAGLIAAGEPPPSGAVTTEEWTGPGVT